MKQGQKIPVIYGQYTATNIKRGKPRKNCDYSVQNANYNVIPLKVFSTKSKGHRPKMSGNKRPRGPRTPYRTTF